MKQEDIQEKMQNTMQQIEECGLNGLLVVTDGEGLHMAKTPEVSKFTGDKYSITISTLILSADEITDEETLKILMILEPVASRMMLEEKKKRNTCDCPNCVARRAAMN